MNFSPRGQITHVASFAGFLFERATVSRPAICWVRRQNPSQSEYKLRWLALLRTTRETNKTGTVTWENHGD